MKVLLVDNGGAADKTLAKSITQFGYETVSASDDSEALAILGQEDAPGVVVVNRTGDSGTQSLKLCKQFKSSPDGLFTYVILLANDEEAAEASSTEDGPDDLLTPSEEEEDLHRLLQTGERFACYISSLRQKADVPLSEPLPEEQALRLIQKRLVLQFTLGRLGEERKALRKELGELEEETSEVVSKELATQNRELQKIPEAKQARDNIEQLKARIVKMEEKVEAEESDPLDPTHVRTLQLAFQQWTTFIRLENETSNILRDAFRCAAGEPLYQLFEENDIDANELYAWAVYAIVLEQFLDRHIEWQQELRSELNALKTTSSKGLLGVFSISSRHQKEGELRADREKHSVLIQAIEREKQFLEKRMTDAFWKVYQEAAVLLVAEELSPEETHLLRAFLRYCMIGQSSWFLPTEVARHLLDDCYDVRTTWEDSMSVTHALYADEYIYFSVKGSITSSFDQDLEMNKDREFQRWKTDKIVRRSIFARVRESTLEEKATLLAGESKDWNDKKEKLTEKQASLDRSDKKYRELNLQCQNEIKECKIEQARYTRIVERIKNQYVPEVQEHGAAAKEKLPELEEQRESTEVLARREATEIRQMSRLCAKLKEPFPPLTLHHEYKLDSNRANSRKTILAEIADIEKRDPTIFQQLLVPSNKPENRSYLRFSPYFLILPTYGIMGFSWYPRHGTEVGRLAFPGYCPRGDQRKLMLFDICSDFRWDTSKAKAGKDLMTSDTICAAYATVRWNYRKRNEDVREKAGIYTDDSDRKNWRRHYHLYMLSALEAGKKLFDKNKDVYDEVVVRYIEFPKGLHRLKRT